MLFVYVWGFCKRNHHRHHILPQKYEAQKVITDICVVHTLISLNVSYEIQHTQLNVPAVGCLTIATNGRENI